VCQRLIDKQVSWHPSHHVEHLRIIDALPPQARDQAIAGTLRGHTDALVISF
jgi:hypothetical protein